MELLLQKGALIEATNEDTETPLHLVARGGHTDTVELLVMKGASIEATDIPRPQMSIGLKIQTGHKVRRGLSMQPGFFRRLPNYLLRSQNRRGMC